MDASAASSGPPVGVRYVMVARLSRDGIESFVRYEEIVLPLLTEHGGHLEQRLRSPDGLREVHVLWFPSPEAFEEYRSDYRRTAHKHLLDDSGATTEVFEVSI
ncbi:hypothetical protein [Hoyosella subflava]|uniref:DUF1330 domain-containing protein n=1 Tax=Hoyosella subflava (strain DSM 45089 / JCM 17490 / NBRC 109087 / DQS3-9A1) TaxID=443218 RepID=F6EFN8_HOYSD|nr:hypothetical protein [Hoyosella subflava]AEF40967.1 hypothetical protein AS9A_2520 [Hoyosella subflava DQS3-9A1]